MGSKKFKNKLFTHTHAQRRTQKHVHGHVYMYDIYTCICYVYESILPFNPYVEKLIIL